MKPEILSINNRTSTTEKSLTKLLPLQVYSKKIQNMLNRLGQQVEKFTAQDLPRINKEMTEINSTQMNLQNAEKKATDKLRACSQTWVEDLASWKTAFGTWKIGIEEWIIKAFACTEDRW